MTNYDPDDVNALVAERRHEEEETRKLKNRILAMTPGRRKTDMWQRNFPMMRMTGEIINSPVY